MNCDVSGHPLTKLHKLFKAVSTVTKISSGWIYAIAGQVGN